MIHKIKKQWFLLSLIISFVVVIFDPSNTFVDIGFFLKKINLPQIMIFSIFIISGLLIDSQQIKAGLKDMKATLVALFVILIFAPMAALLLAMLPLETGVIIGLFIVAVMPTTLSSGIVMTKAAGGNMAHALFITILSNFIGIFTIPIILPWLLSFLDQNKELLIDQGSILFRLILLVLLPLIIGMVVKAKIFKDKSLPEFKMQILNQCMIIGIVFISLAGSKKALLDNGVAFFYILALVGAFHFMLLGTSFLLVKILGITKGRYESVILMGSQKTLALSALIQVTYFSEFGTALLVCVVHHIVHLMIDGYLSIKMYQVGASQNR